MAKKLYIGVKLNIGDPYMVRVTHTDLYNEFRSILTSTRKLIHGTWAYCNPVVEHVALSNPPSGTVARTPLPYIFDSEQVTRTYWAFKDEVDAMQFRLTVGEGARQVFMWPNTLKFTVYEVTNDQH